MAPRYTMRQSFRQKTGFQREPRLLSLPNRRVTPTLPHRSELVRLAGAQTQKGRDNSATLPLLQGPLQPIKPRWPLFAPKPEQKAVPWGFSWMFCSVTRAHQILMHQTCREAKKSFGNKEVYKLLQLEGSSNLCTENLYRSCTYLLCCALKKKRSTVTLATLTLRGSTELS